MLGVWIQLATTVIVAASSTGEVVNVRWVSHVLSEAMLEFAPTSPTNPQCNRDSWVYLQALSNSTLWAVQMLDASSVAVGGLLSGDKYSLGHYDQCLAVQQGVRAQYCLATLQYGPSPKAFPSYYSPPKEVFREPPSSGPVWDKVKMTLDPEVTRRDVFHWALCVPASCTPQDLQEALNSTLEPVLGKYNLQGNVSVDPEFCQTRDKHTTLPNGYLVVRLVIYLLVAVTSVATAYDCVLMYKNPSLQPLSVYTDTPKKMLLAFSLRVNWTELFQKEDDPKVAVASGAKAIAIGLALCGHRVYFSHLDSQANQEFFEQNTEKHFWQSSLFTQSHIIDVFFYYTGLFSFMSINKTLENKKSINFARTILLRWLRLVPSYLMMMGFVGWMLPHLSQGPLWTKRVGLEAERCQQNWWLNLLFINNYVHADNQCLLLSWYLACNMQLYVVGLFAIYVLWRWPKVGYALFALLIAASMAIPFYVTYKNRFYGTYRYSTKFLRDYPVDAQLLSMYVTTYSRAAPHFIGVLTAYIAPRLLRANCKLSTRTILLGTLVFFGGGCAHQTYAFLFYQRDRPYSVLENALYAGLHRVTYALGLAWISGTFYLTLFEPFRVLLGLPLFTPLSRLMYGVALIHPTVQLAQAASIRHSEFMEYPKLIWMACGDYLLSSLLALLLYLMVEGPSKTISNILFADKGIQTEKITSQKNGGSEKKEE